MHIYIYIYVERERETCRYRERDIEPGVIPTPLKSKGACLLISRAVVFEPRRPLIAQAESYGIPC